MSDTLYSDPWCDHCRLEKEELKDWYENILVPDAEAILDPGMVQPTWYELSDAGLEDVKKMYCEYLKEQK